MRLTRQTLSWLLLTMLAAAGAPAQQGSTQNAPIFAVNSQYVQGVAPGYWPTAGGGLALNIASGTASCGATTVQYPGGTLSLAASTINYVYLDPVVCQPTFNTTGFPVNAVSLATVQTGAGAISTVLDQRTWFSVPNVVSLLNAASFTGSSVGAQIDNGCGSLGGGPGVLVIPSNMGSGQSLAGLANGCAVLDLRGPGPSLTGELAPNFSGDENGSEARFLFRERLGALQPGIPSNIETVEVYQEPYTGGTNSTSAKSNYTTMVSSLVRRTPGQGTSTAAYASCYSAGDCEPLASVMFAYEDENAGGDEGAIGLRVGAYQGNGTPSSEFHATVSSVSGTTVNYNSAALEDTRGEQRLLINTNASKDDSTGTITGISGTPPVVTGSGTRFSTNHGGVGTKTSLCFELAGSAGRYNSGANPVHDVFPVASVGGDGSLTLATFFEGINTPWFGDVSSGNYTLYPCSTVTSLGLSGSLKVSDASQFASGDTILMPIGHTDLNGMMIVVDPLTPEPFQGNGGVIQNLGVRPLATGLAIQGNWSGSALTVIPLVPYYAPSRGILFTTTFPTPSALAPTILEYDDGGTNNLVTALAIGRNALANFANFQYDKSADNWLFSGNAGINGPAGSAGFGTVPQGGWQGWFNISGASSNGVEISMPNNGTGTGLSVAYGGIPALSIAGNGSNGSTWRMAQGANLIGYSDNQATQTWNINSSTGNAAFNNLPEVYNAAGTAQTGAKLHMVEDQVSLSSGTATVTLSSAAAFTSSSSYRCTATDQTAASAVRVANSSGTAFTVSGTGSDSIAFICVGT